MYTRFYMLLLQAIWWATLVSRAWFPGGWCGPDGCADRQQRACSIFFIFRNTGTTSINFPVWYHRWWSNLGEFQRHENAPGLSYGLPRFLMMRVSCLAMFISCTGGRLVAFADWRCLVETCTLQQPQLWPGTLWWNCFFPSPSLLRQLPKNYSAFPGISGRLFLKIHSDGFTAPLQLVFLPFLTKFLMKGLVRWVLPVCYCMEYCPLEIT